MKLFEDIQILKQNYTLYGESLLGKISEKYEKVGDDIKLKIPHGLSMCDSVGKSTINSGLFNESYYQSGCVDGLLHDIGRFEQYLLSGTLKDTESIPFTGFNDHGQYGKHILLKNNKEMLREYLPLTNLYDEVLTEVVGEHTQITNPNYNLSIETLTKLFQNYSLEEVLKSNNKDLINKLVALKLKLVNEEDSLELQQKIADGLWKPILGFEKKYYAADKIWDLFINFENINMKELKEQGLWTCNGGYLLRYGLLMRKINFVGSLKTLCENGIVDKIYENQMKNVETDDHKFITDIDLLDPRFKQGYEYTKLAIQSLIETSPDGIIITDASREEAKELTKKRFK